MGFRLQFFSYRVLLWASGYSFFLPVASVSHSLIFNMYSKVPFYHKFISRSLLVFNLRSVLADHVQPSVHAEQSLLLTTANLFIVFDPNFVSFDVDDVVAV